MVVVFILALLLTIATYQFRRINTKIKRNACVANMKNLHSAAALCVTEHPELDNKDLTPTQVYDQGYLRSKPVCPSGGRYAITNEENNITVTCFNPQGGPTEHGSYPLEKPLEPR